MKTPEQIGKKIAWEVACLFLRIENGEIAKGSPLLTGAIIKRVAAAITRERQAQAGLREALKQIAEGLTPCETCGKAHTPYRPTKKHALQWDNDGHAYRKKSQEDTAKAALSQIEGEAPANNAGGFLEVGTNGKGEIVVNLDQDRTGHIIFSPEQAKHLANLLFEKAQDAIKETRLKPGDGGEKNAGD